mgnify:CR=1 FL=1
MRKQWMRLAKSNYQSDFLGGQNHIALFAEAAKKIDMSNISDYDKDCNEQIQQCLHPYFEGKISLAQGMDDFIKDGAIASGIIPLI